MFGIPVIRVAAWLLALFPIFVVAQETAADRDWQAITSSGPAPQRKAGESSLAHFMRTVELSDRRHRELGLKFWEKYPQDPRRYKWLLLTVHMPPHYPRDIDKWARNETLLEINKTPIDSVAQKKWDRRYPALREAFRKAREVSAQERRFLWFGELEQRILRMQEAVARGRKVDGKALLAGVIEYSKDNSSALSEADSPEFYACYLHLIGYIFKYSGIFDLDPQALQVFVDQLMVLAEGTPSGKILERVAARYFDLAGRDAREQALTAAEEQWKALPEYPGGSPSTFEGMVIFHHQQNVFTRKYRDIGLRLWSEYPDHARRGWWLYMTQDMFPFYPKDFARGIRLMAEHRHDDIAIDEDAKAEWDRTYPVLFATLWNDPQTTKYERGRLRAADISFRLFAPLTQIKWDATGDKAEAKALLNDIQEQYTVYGDANSAFRSAQVVFRDFPRFGLSETEVIELFVEPMLRCEDKDLKSLAEGKQRYFRLRQGGIELNAPRMDGAPFDIKELRGKIVLIDYWATTCSSCIATMPRIKDIYDRYRDRGFEVVSVCFDAEERRTKVERNEKELGLNWITLAPTRVISEVIKERYGYSSVPQYMLLDREGKLVAGTAEISMGRNIEPLLEGMLADEKHRRQ